MHRAFDMLFLGVLVCVKFVKKGVIFVHIFGGWGGIRGHFWVIFWSFFMIVLLILWVSTIRYIREIQRLYMGYKMVVDGWLWGYR